MAFKINISDKGISWRTESNAEFLIGKSVGDKVNGEELGRDFEGYEFEITGGSDNSGFPLYKEVEGIGLRRVLLKKGWGMHNKRKGVRLRKTVRGKTIFEKTVQINMKLVKEGGKKLREIFQDQNKKEEQITKNIIEKDVESIISA